MSVIINGKSLTLNDIEKVSFLNEKVKISSEVESNLNKSIKVINNTIKNGKVTYGINTGFGKLCDKVISNSKLNELQINLIRSHSTGVGKPLEKSITMASMLIRANSLANGYSGIQPETLKAFITLVNNNIYPYIPDTGSLGASGDLAPLSHLALVLIGEGKCFENDKLVDSKKILEKIKLEKLSLKPKEGLALINGTAVSSGIFAIDLIKAKNNITASICSSILSLEAFCGRKDAFLDILHKLKPHKGQIFIANTIYKSIKDSKLTERNIRVQDPYSFRCIPQVIGPVIDSYNYCKNVLEIEVNSVTDNPIIFPDSNCIISGGNFHAEPIALVSDFLSFSMSVIGEISERRVNHLLDNNLNGELPCFLTSEPGTNSGLMIIQYTDAALVSKNKVLSYPSCLTSIPVSANQEDFVSQACNSVLKLSSIIDNLSMILAIELIVSAQALEFREKSLLGRKGKEIYSLIRDNCKPLIKDRPLTEDIEKISNLIAEGEFRKILPSCEVL